MSRKFIGYVAVAALAVTVIGSRPAQANNDLATALAALVGVAIVGGIIANNLDDEKKASKYRSKAPTHFREPSNSRGHQIYRQASPKHTPRRANRYVLPGDCLRSFKTRDGRQRIFETRCLQAEYSFTNTLPRSCGVKIRTHNKQRRGYDAGCLGRAGYKLARS
ncbi:MAG: hypothetical protein AB8B62_09875 [Roseobacter sp.]